MWQEVIAARWAGSELAWKEPRRFDPPRPLWRLFRIRLGKLRMHPTEVRDQPLARTVGKDGNQVDVADTGVESPVANDPNR